MSCSLLALPSNPAPSPAASGLTTPTARRKSIWTSWGHMSEPEPSLRPGGWHALCGVGAPGSRSHSQTWGQPPRDADTSSGTHGRLFPPDPGALQQSKVRRVWTWGQEPRVQALTLTFNSGCDRRQVTGPFCTFTSFVEWISRPWEPAEGKGLGQEQWVAPSCLQRQGC